MKKPAETTTHRPPGDPYALNSAIFLFGHAIREVLSSLPHESSLVDVGVGNGQTTLLFRELGYSHIELVDVENHLDPEIEATTPLRQCNLSYEPLPYPDDSVDIFTAFQVLVF